MTVYAYYYNDPGAPSLSGTAGDLITVLDACLVGTGGIAYGSTPSAGWTKSFSGTNGADYRQGTGSSLFYLDVNDNGPGAGTGKEARIKGYEAMTAYQTGTSQFPTSSQNGGLLYVRKSASLDVVKRPWIIVADQRTFYMFILTGDTVGSWSCIAFGDIYSFRGTSDIGRCVIMGRITENSATMTSSVELGDVLVASVGSTSSGHYIARPMTGEVGSVAVGKLGSSSFSNASTVLLGTVVFPNTSSKNLFLSPVYISQSTGGNIVRGRFRGFWHFCHPLADSSDQDTYSGTQDLNGKTFLFIKQGGNSSVYCMEISNTWEAN